MNNYNLQAEPIHYNLSPIIFKNIAKDFFKCYLDFEPVPGHFSPIPYFLCCRAIEMAFKAIHLDTKNRKFVKSLNHNLVDSYEKLDKEYKILSKNELSLLRKANAGYLAKGDGGKGFEYLPIIYLVSGSKYFPDPGALADLTKKITEYVDGLHLGG
jgi:hypothetical protein